ncbi:ATP-dependent Clp protease proteolytic subunit [Hydrococcus rivularis NIES-593]|uniref:ATP-dependent Clp protease proteolytic subunit n=1 Tax=Hydrococcus rivularis NIES-593 TaxID=1921803 RepID=A0A1U7HR82_9CYAN|nr:ATP-dependent Clp protease proteolytic subunit [Hydrococcus rivularis]OKH26103.1 ATP-dependent Clp protease proteolytic subunit [Hydrococcus rivularis NIES-593]
MTLPDRPDIPIAILPSDKEEKTFDIYSRLLAERMIFLRGELTEETANLIVAQMLFLDAEDPEKDITFLINSSGGSAIAAMTVYDIINQICPDVCTVCIGTAAAIGAFLLSCGAKDKRYALPNARMILRQPSANAEGQTSDVEAAAREIIYLRDLVNRILATNTGKSKEQIDRDSKRDFIMSAEEARDYGLIDRIVNHKLPS